MPDSTSDQVLDIVRKRGMLRPRELDRYGLPRQYLHRLHQRGELVRLGRGLYALPDHELTEHHDLAETSTRVPHGVVCLLSALRFHDLRHTAATLLLAQGVHPKVVQEMLGHSTVSLTLDTYSHVIPGLQEEAAAKMEALLASR